MKQEWIDHYHNAISDEWVKIPGYTGCTERLDIALSFAFKNLDKGTCLKPVLFFITVKNLGGYKGINMGSESCSAYPNECETLFNEGIDIQKQSLMFNEGMTVRVLDVHEVTIDNKDEAFAKYNGKTITIIHLFHKGH